MAELTYMQNLVGRNKELSHSDLAKTIQIKRQSVHRQIKQPVREWKLGRLEEIAELMGWDLLEMIKNALEYEPKPVRDLPDGIPTRSRLRR